MSASDPPRKGDLFLLRRTGTAEPPFTGLWMHLTEGNVLEFKGPTDGPEEADLDKLMHVGTGIGYRFNEERRQSGGGTAAEPDWSNSSRPPGRSGSLNWPWAS